jgi:hypothetical protein
MSVILSVQLRMKSKITLFLFLLAHMSTAFSGPLEPVSPGSAFHKDANGNVYLVKLDCNYVRPNYEARPKYETIKLEGLNAANIEPVGRGFIRSDGKLYDAFYPALKKQGSSKTHFIANSIDVKTFNVIDPEQNYFQDKNSIYYYERYPTSGSCLFPSPEGRFKEPIALNRIVLSSQEELTLYKRGQSFNIRTQFYNHDVYTPYAKLGDALYWVNDKGQFTKIVGANVDKFRSLSTQGDLRNLYTDENFVFFNGEITDIKLKTFAPIQYRHVGGAKIGGVPNFFKANGAVYYLTDKYRDLQIALLKTSADPDTFEAMDTNGSYSGVIFKDKTFRYFFDKNTKQVERSPFRQ